MIRRVLLLLAATVALGALLAAPAIASAAGPAEAQGRVGAFDQVSGDRVGGRSSESPAKRQGSTANSAQIASAYLVAARGGSEAFHYTSREALESIQREGLRKGSYATSKGDLSPLQAQIDLALPPNRGLRDAVIRVDLAGLRNAGYQVPEFSQVGRKFNMPGGGYEVQFDHPVPSQFLQVVRP